MARPAQPLHAVAVRGFGREAETYDRGRPGYPPAAVDWLAERLGLAPGRRVVEVAAGTGKLTEALAPLLGPGDLLAVEPVAGMRQVFARRLPEVELRDGRAEALPCADASADAVLVGQAFHWFDAPAARAEIRRVLRPGGGLGLLWNLRDERRDWVAAYGRLIHAHRGDAPRYPADDWQEGFAGDAGFTPLELARFDHVQQADPETLVDRAASTSYVAALDEARHREARDAVRRLLDTHPQTRGRDAIELPYVTEVFACLRRERRAEGGA